jgi:hemerythrin-like domain-containing protein
MADGQLLTDTSDMVAIHNTFRRALNDAPAQIKAVTDGDTERARRLADYLTEVLWLLHVHHEGEDELLYPLLVERAPEHSDLFSDMEAQHASVASSLESATRAAQQFGASGSAADGEEAARACTTLLESLAGHLGEEEEKVLPIAARVISPPEWGALPQHALSQYQGDRIWLLFGLALEPMNDEMRDNLLGHLPPPVLAMWTGGGSDAFTQEISVIRNGA